MYRVTNTIQRTHFFNLDQGHICLEYIALQRQMVTFLASKFYCFKQFFNFLIYNNLNKQKQVILYYNKSKMADKNSAPAYTFGANKKLLIVSNDMPGPGAYESISYFNTDSSDKKIPKGRRFPDYGTVAPGPGAYTVIPNKDHIPTALIKPKAKDPQIQKIPGPGSYEPDFHKIIKSNSCYKIGQSEKNTSPAKANIYIPGPGQYQTDKSTLLGLNQAVKFGPQRKIVLGNDPKTPGPGKYQANKLYDGNAIARQPNIIFSKSARSLSNNSQLPGPGTYLIKTQLEDSIKKQKGFKISWRQPTIEDLALKANSLPGPGAYQSHSLSLTKKSMPTFTVGKQQKLKIQNIKQILLKPGPLKYENKITALQNRSAIIGKDKRKSLATESVIPGPGSYQYKTLLSNQTYSLPKSQRKSLGDNRQTPGPQEYNPSPIVNTQYNNIGIGIGKRKTFQVKQKFPGPGNYDPEQKKNSGGVIIGKDKRDHEKKSITPGPGHYEMQSIISNLPRYASTEHK